MEAVLRAALGAIMRGERVAMVSPVSTGGSIPTGREARMLVFEGGRSQGTVGGGELEAGARTAAQKAIAEQKAQVLQTSMVSDNALASDPICGGIATLLIEPLDTRHRDVLSEMVRLFETREVGVEAVRMDRDEPMRLVMGCQGTSVGSLGDTALDEEARVQFERVIDDDLRGEIVLETGEHSVHVYVNALRRFPVLYVFGAGHVGQAVAQIAPSAGFRVVVIDDRPEFANRERLPMAEAVYVRSFSKAFDDLPVDDLTFVAIMTRGHQWDRDVLAQALRTPAGYIGMMGSRRKVNATFEALKADGFQASELDRVHAPIGLNLGGDTPGEIAISVVAELLQTRYFGKRQVETPGRDMKPVPWDVLLSGCR